MRSLPLNGMFGFIVHTRDKGEIECWKPKTGKTNWADKLPKIRSNFYSSPLITVGMIYAPREDGVVFTIKVSDEKFELVATNELGESTLGSPIVVGNQIFVRGLEHLYCFAAAE